MVSCSLHFDLLWNFVRVPIWVSFKMYGTYYCYFLNSVTISVMQMGRSRVLAQYSHCALVLQGSTSSLSRLCTTAFPKHGHRQMTRRPLSCQSWNV